MDPTRRPTGTCVKFDIRVSVAEHLHNQSPYYLHSMIKVSPEALHAVLYLTSHSLAVSAESWHAILPGSGDPDSEWPLELETVTGPPSLIRACSCPPRLAGRWRMTGCQSDSDEEHCAASRSAMLPRFQVTVLRAAQEQVLRCFSCLRANLAFFPKIPAAARRHSGAMAQVIRAARASVTRCGPSHSPGRGAARHYSRQRPARLTRPGPSHSQRPAVHHSSRLARPHWHSQHPHSQRPAVTLREPPSPASGRHGSPSPQPAVTRRGPPSQ